MFGTPTDLSHIFCQTSVNIYCGDLVLLSAVIVNLPSLCLLTDESDPWPGGCKREGWRSVCVLVSGGLRISFYSHKASYTPHSVIMPGSILSYPFTPSAPQKTSNRPLSHTHTHTTTTTLWPATKGGVGEDIERWREGYGGRLWMGWGDVKVVRGQPGAATICGYIFSPEPHNVRLALGLSAAFWCG